MTTESKTKLQPRRFNVDEYYKMGELGILPEGGCELLNGVVYMKGVGGPWRFTVDDYYKMAEVGILDWDERLELLNGEIIEMSPIGSRHARLVDLLAWLFITMLGTRAWVRIQNPLRLNGSTEPEPDIMLLRWRDDEYDFDLPYAAGRVSANRSLRLYPRQRPKREAPHVRASGNTRKLDSKHSRRSSRSLYRPDWRHLPNPPRIRGGRNRQPIRLPGRIHPR